MSVVRNISVGQLGCLSGNAPSQLLHPCSLAEYEKLEEVLDFIAEPENISLVNILLVLNLKHTATGRKINSITAETRTPLIHILCKFSFDQTYLFHLSQTDLQSVPVRHTKREWKIAMGILLLIVEKILHTAATHALLSWFLLGTTTISY